MSIIKVEKEGVNIMRVDFVELIASTGFVIIIGARLCLARHLIAGHEGDEKEGGVT